MPKIPEEKHWKPLASLKDPFNDALNYRSRTEKEFFQKLFFRTEELSRILSPQVYFLIGEKGAGKTAYAVYLENTSNHGQKCKLTTMTETQYKRFIELKRQGKLSYSDYANIWRSMLLFIVARMVVEKSKGILSYITGKFSKIEREIDAWSKNALNPEVETAFEAINSEALNAKLKNEKVGEVGGELKNQQTEKASILKHHLLDTENSLKEAISSLSLQDDHILFIDGIDYRPELVPYNEYIACIKGLAEAAWQLNTEYFNLIRDTKGRIRIVLLVRPDVFHSLNLYNSNSRLQDNSIFLDWSTTEKEYKGSRLLEACGKYFSSQQNFTVSSVDAWEQYYGVPHSPGHVFKRLLKQSFHKPRDILTYIRITKRYVGRGDGAKRAQFPTDIGNEPAITREFSDYLLGEVKNYAAFYMPQEDFGKYLKFFQYLDGKPRFTMSEFIAAFKAFKSWAGGEAFAATEYLRDAESLLQFWYDVNVIGYSEEVERDKETFYHWSYRERSANNIAPKVKTTGTLILNPGIAKAIDIGKKMSHKFEGKPEGPRHLHAKHRNNRQHFKKQSSNMKKQSANIKRQVNSAKKQEGGKKFPID